MDEQECLVAYLELVEMLNEFGLNWLVKRVADTIKRGKTVTLPN